jgi:hypothetical protein
LTAFRRRGVDLPPPMVVADSWFSDSKLMRHVATTHQGTFLVEGKSTYVFELPMGARSRGVICRRKAIGPGVIARRSLACAMRACGRPVRRTAR